MQAIDFVSEHVIKYNLVPYLVSTCAWLSTYILFNKRPRTKRIREGLNLGVDICDLLDGRREKEARKRVRKPPRK
jgi:hypothetical protein